MVDAKYEIMNQWSLTPLILMESDPIDFAAWCGIANVSGIFSTSGERDTTIS
ncbi:MAG: hypothetical protein WC236_00130 [Gallionellaceae bacterium]|jgi:hypothetical protein